MQAAGNDLLIEAGRPERLKRIISGEAPSPPSPDMATVTYFRVKRLRKVKVELSKDRLTAHPAGPELRELARARYLHLAFLGDDASRMRKRGSGRSWIRQTTVR